MAYCHQHMMTYPDGAHCPDCLGTPATSDAKTTLAGDMFPSIPLDEQIAAVEREISMRERVYGRRVNEGKMILTEAERGISQMKAVRDTLLVVKERDGTVYPTG